LWGCFIYCSVFLCPRRCCLITQHWMYLGVLHWVPLSIVGRNLPSRREKVI
jgi:hypothetical protein